MASFKVQKIALQTLVVLMCLLVHSPLSAKKLGFFNWLTGKKEAVQEQETIVDPVAYNVSFVIKSGSNDLEKQLKKVSLLEGNKETLPSGSSGLMKRALNDQARLTTALEAFGFFSGRIQIFIADRSLQNEQTMPYLDALLVQKKELPVKIVVDAGEEFKISSVEIKLTQKNNDFIVPTLKNLNIEIGSPAKSVLVLDAEKILLVQAKTQGFAFAKLGTRTVTVNHKTKTMRIVLNLQLGRKARFGKTEVVGGNNLTGFVEKRIPWKEGDDYSTEAEAKLRTSLQKHGVFQSIRIREDLANEKTGEVPITVEVQERLPHFVGFGTKFSTTEGVTANAYWGHRNLFGGGERLRIEGETFGVRLDKGKQFNKISTTDQIGYRFAASFTKPDIFSVKDEITIIPSAVREITQYYTREGFNGSATYKYQLSDKLRLEAGVDYEYAKIDRFYDPSFANNKWYSLLGTPFSFNYDTTTNLLDPRQGFRVSGTIEPFLPIGTASSEMVLVKGSASAYIPIDDEKRFVLATRVGFGSLSGADFSDIPPPRRFFAGGGGSVRGYDYKSLGPKNPDGWVIGGRSLFEASVELRTRVTKNVGIVTFIDAGNAFAENYPNFDEDLRYSVGLGLRYHTAIGPLRLDVARGLNLKSDDPKYGIYISIGQAF